VIFVFLLLGFVSGACQCFMP